MDDLKIIKKYYGEKMSRLCRELFPTLLETPGYLSNFLLERFEPSRLLYDDIISNNLKDGFKNYVYSFSETNTQKVEVNQTPTELLSSVGYDLYECKTEADIQKFEKYYAPGEEICTFNGGRLNWCHVFFAVKRNATELNRKDFKNPKRQDEYGTSVISIQFTRGEHNTISIKNRYNHTVDNPDATFGNNLDSIVYGLTSSFEKYYGYDLSYSSRGFEIPGYVQAEGKYIKYNYEKDNVYYCANNIIVDNHKIIRDYQQMERYIVFDYFILDLQEKKLRFYADKVITDPQLGWYGTHAYTKDTFINTFKNIKKIEVIRNKSNGHKTIYIKTKDKEIVEIEINRYNQMIRYKNNNIRKLEENYLCHNIYLEELELNNVVKINKNCLYYNKNLKKLSLKNIYEIRANFLFLNNSLKNAIFSKNFFIEDGFMGWNSVWDPQPVGIKNKLAVHLRANHYTFGIIDLFQSIAYWIMKYSIKMANCFYNKKEMNFEDDNIKIVSIKKSSKVSQFINYIVSKLNLKKNKQLEAPIIDTELVEEKGKSK